MTTGNTSNDQYVPPATPAPNAPAPPAGAVDITTMTGDMVNNPTLPNGTVVNPVLQTTNPNELLNNQTPLVAGQATGAAPVVAQQATAAEAQAQQVKKDELKAAEQAAQAGSGYQAEKIGAANAQVATAQQGTVSKQATVQGQLEQLTNFDPSKGPAWANAAMRAAQETMGARGLGASSIAGAAVVQAIMEAALPIAQQDAQTFAQMDIKNLDNRQQAEIDNAKSRQQIMLSDQSMENAARQFNAQSKTQTAQFFAGLMADIDKANMQSANEVAASNARNKTETAVANAQTASQVALANAEQANGIAKFNTEQDNAFAKFQREQQLIIDQSNAEWRRNINTNNTAAVNAANQVNATNLLSISNTAMNNLWAAARDQAHWAWQAGENAQDRALNMTIAAFNRDTQFDLMSEADRTALFQSLGSFAFDILGGFLRR